MTIAHPRKSWTYEDLLALPDDGKRYEIIEGELFEMTGPNWDHGTVIFNLQQLLTPFVLALGGTIRTASVNVFLLGDNLVLPDLFAMLPGGAAPSVRGLEGPPDLVVEVLSPSNRDHDRYTKRALYGVAGVREYWIVDPEARTVEVLTLHQDALHSAGTFSGDARIPCQVLPEAAVAAADVFAGLDDIAP